MQAKKSVAKEQDVSTQLQRELCNANQQLSQVCCTSSPGFLLNFTKVYLAGTCMRFVTTVILLNGKRCLVTAVVSVQRCCRTVKKHIFCCRHYAFLRF